MKIISDWKEFRSVCNSDNRIYLWGCGMKAMLLFEAITLENLDVSFEAVLVTDKKANITELYGCEVKEFYMECMPDDDDIILISTMSVYWDEISQEIRDRGCNSRIYAIDERLEGAGHLDSLSTIINPFVRSFDEHQEQKHCNSARKIIWSCWWQGEDQAPDIVKSCWRSWKKYVPDSYKVIIITKDNYNDYVDPPEFMLEKVADGKSKLQYLTDMMRMVLLYRYGGIWMDATVYLTDDLPVNEIEKYNIYTYRLPAQEYGSDVSWTIWFIAGKPGQMLFRFIYESIEWYFARYDKTLFYLQPDYTISIACQIFPEVENDFRQVPVRKGNPSDLRRVLNAPFDIDTYNKICHKTSIHKLSWYGNENIPGSFYDFIVNHTFQTRV